ncbi:FliM/FliN family flagellar motor C-terminal domain-containing protein [Delftia acidovorans]|uniref:FliM/FliN family flagellar motor C-terminal domain-containing protein n=1 Tax=Delftia acidovorans TaxID=80866 RepID=UPI00243097E1|nr:flagellar motor switch protein FliM [Delftia acidovorans]
MAAGLLSLQESGRARPLRVWSARQKEKVYDAVQAVLLQWHADWSMHGDAPGAPAALRVQDPGANDGEGVDMLDEQAAPRALHALLFGQPAADPDRRGPAAPALDMAAGLCAQAWQSLNGGLRQLAGASLGEHQGGAPGLWSGAVVLALDWGGVRWVLHLNASAVEQVLASRGELGTGSRGQDDGAVRKSLVPLASALHSQTVTVRLELNPISLSLGQLQSLAPGDVITLTHALEQPALLRLQSRQGMDAGELLCTGWLGQSQGRLGVELQPLSNTSS